MSLEELVKQIRENGSLKENIIESRRRIARMCKERRPPSMTIPVQYYDDDFFINQTLHDAEARIAELEKVEKAARAYLDSGSDDIYEIVALQDAIDNVDAALKAVE